MLRLVRKKVLGFLLLFTLNIEAADIEVIAQAGKRWSETKSEIFASQQSYTFALHAKLPTQSVFSLVLGPSAVLDLYYTNESCEKRACFSANHYKIGIDLGGEFAFPLVRVFLHGRALVYARGHQKLRGKTMLHFPESLEIFENGMNEGELVKRSVGFNVVSGLKWSLFEELYVLLSFELAYEKIRTEDAAVKVSSKRGDLLHLGSSLKTDWHSNNSSAIYMGLAYTL